MAAIAPAVLRHRVSPNFHADRRRPVRGRPRGETARRRPPHGRRRPRVAPRPDRPLNPAGLSRILPPARPVRGSASPVRPPVMPRRVQLYDTTLRDGSQGEGVNFSVQDKLQITQRLDELGFDFVEGGYPLSNPKDAEVLRAGPRPGPEARDRLRVRHDPPAGRRRGGRHRVEGPRRGGDGRRHGRRQDVGPARHRGPPRGPGGEPGDDRRLRRLSVRRGEAGDLRRGSTFSTATGPTRSSPSTRCGPRPRPGRRFAFCATRTAAACRGSSPKPSPRRRPNCPAPSAFTVTTTPTWPRRTPWRRWRRGRCRSRGRSTASASGAATRI